MATSVAPWLRRDDDDEDEEQQDPIRRMLMSPLLGDEEEEPAPDDDAGFPFNDPQDQTIAQPPVAPGGSSPLDYSPGASPGASAPPPSGLGGGTSTAEGPLTPVDVARYARDAGFTGEDLVTAVATAYPESTLNPRAHNPNAGTGDDSYGLWQINMLGGMGPERRQRWGLKSNEDLWDPATNAKAAYDLYKGRGGGFEDWSAYKAGKHVPYMDEARAAVQQLESGGGLSPTSSDPIARGLASAPAEEPAGGSSPLDYIGGARPAADPGVSPPLNPDPPGYNETMDGPSSPLDYIGGQGPTSAGPAEAAPDTGAFQTVGKSHLDGTPIVKYGETPVGAPVAKALTVAEQALGRPVPLNSGYRTYEEQERIYYDPSRTAAAAKPGTSRHESGLAVDVDMNALSAEEQARLVAAMNAAGYKQALSIGEPWHFSPDGR